MKFLTDLLFIISLCRHAHDSGDADVGEFRKVLHQFAAFLYAEPVLGLLGGYMNLQQNADGTAVLGRLLVDLLKEFQGVDAVNQMDERCDVFYFIAL